MEKHKGYIPEDWKNDSTTGPFLDATNVQKMEDGIKDAIDRTNALIDYVDTSIKNSRMMVVGCAKTRPYVNSTTSIGTIPDWNSNKIAIFISNRNVGDYGLYSRVAVVKSGGAGFTSIAPASGGSSYLSIKISDNGEVYARGDAVEVGDIDALNDYTILVTDSNEGTLII